MKAFRDSAETNVIGGKALKTSGRVEAYGTIDELQSVAGLARSSTQDKEIRGILKVIQEDLFTIGAELADPEGKMKVKISAENVKKLEGIISGSEKELEPLAHFILTGGTQEAAMLDICRTITRRAERAVLRLREKEEISNEIFRYINRLSDVFFSLSRLANKRAGEKEEKWVPRK